MVIIVLLTFTGFTVTATASSAESSLSKVEVRVDIQSMPKSMYLKNVPKNFLKSSYVVPPNYVYHTEYEDNVRYTGTLTRTDYADAGNGRWLALYSGHVYR